MSRATFSWVERSWLGRGARVPNGVFGVEGSGVGSRMHGTARQHRAHPSTEDPSVGVGISMCV